MSNYSKTQLLKQWGPKMGTSDDFTKYYLLWKYHVKNKETKKLSSTRFSSFIFQVKIYCFNSSSVFLNAQTWGVHEKNKYEYKSQAATS